MSGVTRGMRLMVSAGVHALATMPKAVKAARQEIADMQRRVDALQVKRNPLVRRYRIGRNDPCPCGSGQKFKRCHINRLDDLDLKLELLRAKQAEGEKT